MLAKDLISNDTPTLFPDMTVIQAITIMEEFKINSLPLIESGEYICLVSDKQLLEIADHNQEIGYPTGFSLSVKDSNHIFDVLDIFSQSNLDILPVVDENNKYLGSINDKTLLKELANICYASSPGAIIQLEINRQDLMISELGRLAEQNNARIINIFTYPDKQNDKLQVFVKVDLENAIDYLRGLERFHYNVIAHYHHEGITDEAAKHRIEELLYYIEM
ncbi:MAG: CBS domain-containing protein [Bacteroidales bacterium]|nr:CBS domain-containing protein [Bacteroidales bacterium]